MYAVSTIDIYPVSRVALCELPLCESCPTALKIAVLSAKPFEPRQVQAHKELAVAAEQSAGARNGFIKSHLRPEAQRELSTVLCLVIRSTEMVVPTKPANRQLQNGRPAASEFSAGTAKGFMISNFLA
jgi:hypothetical protein